MKIQGAASRYNLFRRKAEQHLYCAVPEDCPVPRFVGHAWEFRGRVEDDDAPPPGFRNDAAAAAARLTGYYIFEVVHASQQRETT